MDFNRNQQANRIQNQGHIGTEILEKLQLVVEVAVLFFKVILAICEGIYRFIIPVKEKSVEGEIVLVTGAGHGIGKELALQYAALGAIVVCWDINETSNKNTVSQIKKKGKIAHGYICDVTKRNQVIETVEKVKRDVGNITILVNNAGILISRSLLDHNEEDIKRTMELNVMSHFWILQSVLPSMIENNYGHIVALSSFVGIIGYRYLVPYCTSKFAVRGMMAALREELRFNPKNEIKFTTIFPYIVNTGLCKAYKARFPNLFKEISPTEAARCIVAAQRKNTIEETLPSFALNLTAFGSLLPEKVEHLIRDFINICFESDE